MLAAGQLGLGSAVADEPSPTQIGTADTWRAIALGSNDTCGLQTDATLWCWGSALGSETPPPAQVATGPGSSTDTTWASVSLGGSHVCATRTDGTLWCWGDNAFGKLGLGTPDVRPARSVCDPHAPPPPHHRRRPARHAAARCRRA